VVDAQLTGECVGLTVTVISVLEHTLGCAITDKEGVATVTTTLAELLQLLLSVITKVTVFCPAPNDTAPGVGKLELPGLPPPMLQLKFKGKALEEPEDKVPVRLVLNGGLQPMKPWLELITTFGLADTTTLGEDMGLAVPVQPVLPSTMTTPGK
jgi:hypothetical protein